MLLVPSWSSPANALLTLMAPGTRCATTRPCASMMAAAAFYGLVTFEAFMAIRTVNSLSHYTNGPSATSRFGALGWVAMITFRARSMLSAVAFGSANGCIRPGWWKCTFWLALRERSSTSSRCGIPLIQGLMWRTYNESGTLAYSFVDTMVCDASLLYRSRYRRLLFLIGGLVACYNIWMTIRTAISRSMSGLPIVPFPRSQAFPRLNRRSDPHVQPALPA